MSQGKDMYTTGMGRLAYKFFHEGRTPSEFREAQKIMQRAYIETVRNRQAWPRDESIDIWLDETFGKRESVVEMNTFEANYD